MVLPTKKNNNNNNKTQILRKLNRCNSQMHLLVGDFCSCEFLTKSCSSLS